jgi:hypothetical protein
VLAYDEARSIHTRKKLLRGQELLKQPDALLLGQRIEARIDLVKYIHISLQTEKPHLCGCG